MQTSRSNLSIKKQNVSFPDVKFKCIRCGNCCRNTDRVERRIVLTKKDVETIHSATRLRIEDFADRNNNENYPYAIKLVSEKCFFLDANNTCLVYSYRPLVCRFYPFLLRKIGTKYVFDVDPSCPGLGNGENIDEKYFIKLIREAEKHLGSF
ncbi:MAG: YkgJ family cysteine cluster protein [Thermoproteota archaeon]